MGALIDPCRSNSNMCSSGRINSVGSGSAFGAEASELNCPVPLVPTIFFPPITACSICQATARQKFRLLSKRPKFEKIETPVSIFSFCRERLSMSARASTWAFASAIIDQTGVPSIRRSLSEPSRPSAYGSKKSLLKHSSQNRTERSPKDEPSRPQSNRTPKLGTAKYLKSPTKIFAVRFRTYRAFF